MGARCMSVKLVWRLDVEAFLTSQPNDAAAQETIARTFAPVGPFTAVDVVTVEEL